MYTVSLIDYNGTPNADVPTISKKELYIYDPITHDEGLILSEPILNLEASKAGSFSCTLPETNYGYGRIIKGLTRLIVRKNDKIIFMGRINEEERDLYLNEKVIANGALSYLSDTLTNKKVFTDKTLYEIVSYILNFHNAKYPNEPWKRFYLTQDHCTAKFVGRDSRDVSSDKISVYSVNYIYTFDALTELLNLSNAVLKIEYNSSMGSWDVYIHDRYNLPRTIDQPIEFGENLLNLVQSYDYNDICTAVAPFGGDLVQTAKEIGDVVAGGDSVITDNRIFIRPTADPDADYSIVSIEQDPAYANEGYWAFEFNIAEYNATYPSTPLKRLYLSWRAYRFETIDSEGELTGYIADNAWRIYDASNQTLGHRELKEDGSFESEINEVINLEEAQYLGAAKIIIGGWGGLITPLIRRDSVIVEENDKLTITDCPSFGPDDKGLKHTKGDIYLYSETLMNTYGLIEKKLEYDIEDSSIPVKNWTYPYSGKLGQATLYLNTVLGYRVEYDEEDKADIEKYRGDYQRLPFGSDNAYRTIEYILPDLDDPDRPRGVFVSSRMHNYGIHNDYYIDGMYALFDTSNQLLAYKSAEGKTRGDGFTSIVKEYIDLSDPKYYGAKYLLVGGWEIGVGEFPHVDAIPSDDNFSRDRLLDQAMLYLTDYQWEKVVIEATAVDLSMTTNQWESFDICANASVISSFHGVTTTLPISELSIGFDNIDNNTIKLGYDSDEYLSEQLSENLRLLSIQQSK